MEFLPILLLIGLVYAVYSLRSIKSSGNQNNQPPPYGQQRPQTGAPSSSRMPQYPQIRNGVPTAARMQTANPQRPQTGVPSASRTQPGAGAAPDPRYAGGYRAPSSVPNNAAQPGTLEMQTGPYQPEQPDLENPDRLQQERPAMPDIAPTSNVATEAEGYSSEGSEERYGMRPEWVNTPAVKHLALNRSMLMQAVVYSELLQKPKALRRR
jgi:hypothetical protein